MTIQEYVNLAQRTSNTRPGMEKLKCGIIGLCGETGECADLLKKLIFQGHSYNREKFIEELGDVAWYLAEAAVGLDIPLEEILTRNIKKLQERYPNGFESDRSVNRD